MYSKKHIHNTELNLAVYVYNMNHNIEITEITYLNPHDG